MRSTKWMHTAYGFLLRLLVLLGLSLTLSPVFARFCTATSPYGLQATGASPSSAVGAAIAAQNTAASTSSCGKSPVFTTPTLRGDPSQQSSVFNYEVSTKVCTGDPNGVYVNASPQTFSVQCDSIGYPNNGPVSLTPCSHIAGDPIRPMVFPWGGKSIPTLVCDEEFPPVYGSPLDRCSFVPTGVTCGGKECRSKDGTYTGQLCGPNSPSPTVSGTVTPSLPSATSATNSRPQCEGTINGVVVKYPCVETTTGNTTTKTDSTTPNNVTSTTTTTTCRDGKCTTVTTTTGTTNTPVTPGTTIEPGTSILNPNSPPGDWECKRVANSIVIYFACPNIGVPAGSVTSTVTSNGSTTTSQDQSDFCKSNPKSPQCLGDDPDKNTFSGACQTGFTCDGDAALCAAAKATNETNCQLKALEVTDKTFSVVGTTAATGQDPTDHPRKNKTEVDIGTFNTTNPFSSQCPTDYTITTSFTSVVIPFSSACSVLSFMGQLAVALTSLACAMWLVKG
jgi:hypothetical protein